MARTVGSLEPGVQRLTTTGRWSAAVTSGFVAGIAMGLLMHFVADVMPAVGALYGQPTVLAGWIAHLFHAVVLALVFAAAISVGPLSRYATSVRSVTALGIAYGIVTWVVTNGIVLPLWLDAVGVPGVPFPNLTAFSLLTHLVYGVVLGGMYGIARYASFESESSLGESAADTTATEPRG